MCAWGGEVFDTSHRHDLSGTGILTYISWGARGVMPNMECLGHVIMRCFKNRRWKKREERHAKDPRIDGGVLFL